MKKMHFLLMISIITILSISACGDNEQEPVEQPNTELEDEPALNQKIFEEQIIGSVWQDYRLYEINPITGERAEKDIFDRDGDGGWCGGGSIGWYFEANSLTEYLDADYIPAFAFIKRNITFDKEQNAIFWDGVMSVETGKPIPTFQIESVEDDILRAIYHYGTTVVDGKKYDQYVYGIFTRQSAERLKDLQERCTLDLDTYVETY